MLILGEKEVESKSVGVRSRKDGDIGAMEADEFVNKIKEEINNRSIPPQLKRNHIKDVTKKKIFLYSFCLIIFIGTLLSSDKYNDALSIFTIGVSLLDNELCFALTKIVKRWCHVWIRIFRW